MAIDFINYVNEVIQSMADTVAISVELAYRLHLGDDDLTAEAIKENAKVIIDQTGARHYYWGANKLCSVTVKAGELVIKHYSFTVPIAIKTQEELDKLPMVRIQERSV